MENIYIVIFFIFRGMRYGNIVSLVVMVGFILDWEIK